MTPRQLRYFVAIANAGSLSHAATQLHIAQPSLSQHINNLEGGLGVALFKRHARGVTLTPAGQRLFNRASTILRQLDHLPDEVAAAQGLPRGEVRLAMDGSIAAAVVVPLYKAMEARYPEVRVHVVSGLSHHMRQLVESRTVDLALMPNAFELPSLQSEPVYEERFCLFGARGSFPAQARRIRFDDIGDRALVAADHQHDQRKHIERIANARKRSLNVRYEINDADLTRAIVRGGLAQALLPRNAFAATDKGQTVQALEVTDPALSRVQSIAWPADQPLTPAADATRQCLHETVADLIGQRVLHGRLPHAASHKEYPMD